MNVVHTSTSFSVSLGGCSSLASVVAASEVEDTKSEVDGVAETGD